MSVYANVGSFDFIEIFLCGISSFKQVVIKVPLCALVIWKTLYIADSNRHTHRFAELSHFAPETMLYHYLMINTRHNNSLKPLYNRY